MQHAELATLLVEAGNAEREALLAANSDLADARLGYILKDICLAGWSSHPARALGAAAALRLLFVKTKDREIAALRAWTSGLEALIQGQMDRALEDLEDAQARFLALNKPHTAAATQVSKLIALATLGRYDEAIECGLAAREMFLQHDDLLAAGKIENNIGNIYFRRDDYKEAERFQSAAKRRFALLEDQIQLAKVNNCLANTHALLHKFSSAEQLYEEAVRQAEESGLTTTLAEIEGNIGNFALFQGRYDRALDYLERARRRYASLAMPHQSAIAEQEIADVYLELNLAPEAVEIYNRVIPKFTELKMRAEQARAVAYCGRALILLGKTSEAQSSLSEARRLYEAEGNEVGAAMVMLTQGQLHYRQGNHTLASKLSAEAEPAFLASGSWQRLLLARWLQGEAELAAGNTSRAHSLLEQTLLEAQSRGQPQVAERCYTSLGILASWRGDADSAEDNFKRAIGLTEELRAPIPGEEFRTAFFSDKLVPYNELVRLCLADGRVEQALGFVESARSRALADILGGNLRLPAEACDEFEADLLRQIEALRGELNYLYNQINRPARGAAVPTQTQAGALRQALREREARLLEINRQLQHRGGKPAPQAEAFAVAELQSRLGSDTALVEYTAIGEELLAFVVTNERIEVARNLAVESEVATEIQQFRFQIDALRYGSGRIRKHLPELAKRAHKHLRALYDLLFRKIGPIIEQRRVVVVPHRALHYLPFQALHDGTNYVIEEREISYAPSALVLQQCLDRPKQSFNSALLMGVADEQIPRVRAEIETIARAFTSAFSFLDASATSEVLRANSSGVDVLHLACHAHFRSDNPLFSSLQLGDGWLTVRDAMHLKLGCGLVTLSACETGVNAVAPGDELIGLARGFMAAGSPSVLISLWTVDDQATADLMVEFYHQLRNAQTPSGALRAAQIKLLKRTPHPFFWSPFVLVGRW
jgi:CHAT domain-containing protein